MLAIKTGLQKRIGGFLLFLMLSTSLLIGRIAWVQFADGKRLVEKARNQLRDNQILQSPRGTIYDRNGRELAVSNLTKSLYANPRELNKNPEQVAGLLAPLLDMRPAELREKLSVQGTSFIWLKRTLEPDVAQAVSSLIKEQNIRGLEFVRESKRYYPNDTLAAHVLGFVGTDDIGLDGVEQAMDKEIKGELTEREMDTDREGAPIFQSVLSFAPRRQGKSVYLTLDSTIQFMVEQSLDKVMATTRARGATVIVMDPHTGEILAMASRPAFNPNQFGRYNQEAWKNRAVSNIYEPGSTFKAVVAAAALEEKLVTPDEHFIDPGFVEVSGRRIKNWSDDSFGNVTFTDIIKNSINTGFVQVGMRLGAARLTQYARAFGFGKPTDIELPGEEEGLLFNPRDMRDSDVATMSIGQSIAVTPLQLVTAVGAIANDGVLVKPHIIKEIHNPDGTVASITPVQTVRQAVTLETAHGLSLLMEKVVSEGGAKKASIQGYHFAGKTGTAERLRENGGGYEENHYISSFVGFGPVEKPQIVALVVIDDPVGAYYGGEIAAPVFSEFMAQVLRYLGIAPAVAANPVQLPQPAVLPMPAAAPAVVPPGKVIVPDFTGKTVRETGEIMAKLGLAFVPAGTGTAAVQSVPPNSVVDPGTEITVHFEQR